MSIETPTRSELLDEGIEANAETEALPEIEARGMSPKTRVAIDKEKQRLELRSGVESYSRIKKTGVLENDEIVEATRDWAEGAGMDDRNLKETLGYFELTESVIDNEFSDEQKTELACALAEIVASGMMKAEALQSLAFRVVKAGSSGSMDRVCEYSAGSPVMRVYDELFQEIDGTPQNITHIIAHEVSHGADRYGEIGRGDILTAKSKEMIANATTLRSRETYRMTNAIDQYLAETGRDGATQEEIDKKSAWLERELRAEKVAAYMQSGDEFSGFMAALWRVMPEENIRILLSDKTALDSWIEENQLFFDQIKAQMSDKDALETKVLANTQKAKETITAREQAEDYDSDEMFTDSIIEPGVPDNSKAPQSEGQGGKSWLAMMGELFAAAEPMANQVVPVGEIAKQEA